MMKRLLLSFALICICAMLRAQDFKVVSMSALPMDMTAREQIKVDDNDRKCAVIRIATQNISLSQRKGFHFESDWGSNVVERTLQDGEILVWVSPGLKTLKIKHENLGKWELHTADYGITVEPLHTYKVVLQGTVAPNPDENQEVAKQYLTFQITPANAVLEVNGELWEVGQDGSALKFVDFGTYDYVVKAPNYHSESGTVTVDDPEKTQKVEVRLKSDLVEVTLAVDADAEIWVNNEKKGVRTWTGALGKGTYKIECKQAGHQSSVTTKEITANMAGKAITLPVPKPIHGSLNVESTPSEAKIYIDGKEVGETPKFMKEILVGEHRLKLTKDGYENHEESFVIKKNERTQLTAKLQNKVKTPTSQQTQTPTMLKKPERSVFFVIANAAYSIVPQTSFGLTVGSAKKLGWYVSFGSNFVFDIDYDYTCDYAGQIISDSGLGEYQFSGGQYTVRHALVAGVVYRMSDPLYAYIGGGYGLRLLKWELRDNNTLKYRWAKNMDYSYQGLALDAGLMLHFKGFGLSVGVQSISFDYLEAKLGIGFNLKH